jgi:zinc transporter ZupT
VRHEFYRPQTSRNILYGFAVAAAFPIGALIAIYIPYNASKRALFAAFGAGLFFAAVMLLVQQSLDKGNVYDLLVGFSLGAVTFGAAEYSIRHRATRGIQDEEQKRQKHKESEGKITIVGTILDSVPETLFVGIIAVCGSRAF